MNPGDTFFDELLDGTVTVEGEEQLAYAGETRTITNGETPERFKRWDKSTGVFVLCLDCLESFSVNATAISTNMWGTQKLEIHTKTVFDAFLIGSSVITIVMIINKIKKLKKSTHQ